jgi:hypothetical protein
MNRWHRSALGVCLLFASVTPTLAANLVTNPGFESCTFPAGAAPPPGWTGTAFCDGQPHSGNWAANFQAPVGAPETLSQSISTTPGGTYDFSFWLQLQEGTPFNSTFTASFGADQVLDLSNGSGFGYTLEDFTVTATAASTTISFAGSAQNGTWFLDDVSVTLESVPAPALGSGAAAFAVLGVALALFPLRRLRTRHDRCDRLGVA